MMHLVGRCSGQFDGDKHEEIRENLKDATNSIGYRDIERILRKYCKPSDAVLVSGSSNSVNIMESLYDEIGVNCLIHLSPPNFNAKHVIKSNRKKRKNILFESGFLADLAYEDGRFNVILDIGIRNGESTSKKQSNLLNERFQNVSRLLDNGGRYLFVTSGEEFTADALMSFFKDSCFIRLHEAQIEAEFSTVYSPLFIFVLTKLKIKLTKPVLEIAIGEDKIKRIETNLAIKEALSGAWNYSYLQFKLRNELNPARFYKAQLWHPFKNPSEPRYTLSVIDSSEQDLLSQHLEGKYGIFIVPQGQEHSWLYASQKGQMKLAQMACYRRLIIITLHRGQQYESIDEIKSELSTKIMQLAPPQISNKIKVPFLTVGDSVGYRDVLTDQGTAETHGFIVEDVKMEDDTMYRRLIFKNNPHCIQTESRLLKGSTSSRQWETDRYYLAFDCHKAMVAAMAYIGNFNIDSEYKILLIGLGGGALPCFLSSVFPQFDITCLDLDSKIIEIAKDWFGFIENDKLRALQVDGIKFMKDAALEEGQSQYDMIIFDVNTDDDTMGITSPPQAFLEDDVTANVIKLLSPEGVFVINLACRDEAVRESKQRDLKDKFPKSYSIELTEDINVVMCCLSSERKEPAPDESNVIRTVQLIEERTQKSREKLLIADTDALMLEDIMRTAKLI